MPFHADQKNDLVGYERKTEEKSLRQLIWGVCFLLIGLFCLAATVSGASQVFRGNPDVSLTDACVMSVQYIKSTSDSGRSMKLPVYRIVYDGHVKENIFISGPALHAGESIPIAYLKSDPGQISKPAPGASAAEMLGSHVLWRWLLVALIAPNLIVLGGAIIYEEVMLNE